MKRLIPFALLVLAACSPLATPAAPTATQPPPPTVAPPATATPPPASTPDPTPVPEVNDPPAAPTVPPSDVSPEEANGGLVIGDALTPVAQFSGSGDARLDLNLEGDFVGVIHAISDQPADSFVVENYDKDGNLIGFLVNASAPYDGWRPLDFLNFEDSGSLQVTASGDWTIDVYDIFNAPYVFIPSRVNGNGDFVLVLSGAQPDKGFVQANESGDLFRILGYGRDVSVLVDSTEPVVGSFSIDPDILVLEIQAVGDWQLDVIPR